MLTRELRRAFREQKRRASQKIHIVKVLTSQVDYKYGDKTRTYSVQLVRKALVLPTTLKRDFVYDLSYIAANKNFTLGGYYDLMAGSVIIDTKDISVAPILDDFVVIDNRVYKIAEKVEYPKNTLYAFNISRVEGADYEPVLAAVNN